MKKVIIILIIFALLGSAIYFLLIKNGHSESDPFKFSGTVDVTETRISFKTAGRIDKINFQEGQNVKEGDLIAALDKKDEKLALDAAKANLAYNKAVLNEVLAGSRKQEIRNAKAALDKAQAARKKAAAELKQAKNDRDRYEMLYKERGVSKRDYELYSTGYKKALNAYNETEASVRSAREQLSIRVEGARNEEIKKAESLVAIAEEQLKQAKQKLEYTSVYSPAKGRVLVRSAEPGEYIQPGSVILTIADIKDAWVRGYVNQTVLGKIKIGQAVKIHSDSYPEKTYNGKIIYISDEAEFTPKSVQTYEERVKMMYRIKVKIENDKEELKSGMPVVGQIIVK